MPKDSKKFKEVLKDVKRFKEILKKFWEIMIKQSQYEK